MHKQMCQKIAQLTKVVHRLNVTNQTHQEELEKRERLHVEELLYITNDFHQKLECVASDLKMKDESLAELVRSKERMQCQRAKERNEFKIKLHDVTTDLTSKHVAELNHLRNDYNEIENRSLLFDRKMDEMNCRYKDRESVLATKMMNIQTKGAEEKKQFEQEIRNLTAHHEEEMVKLSHEAKDAMLTTKTELESKCDSMLTSAKTELESKHESMIKSADARFENILADKEVQEQESKEYIKQLHEDIKDMECQLKQSERILRQSNQEMSEEKMLLLSQFKALEQRLHEKELEAGKIINELGETKVEVEQLQTKNVKLKREIHVLVHCNSSLVTEKKSAELELKRSSREWHDHTMTLSLILIELRNCRDEAIREIFNLKVSLEDWKVIVVELRASNNALKRDFISKTKDASRAMLVLKEEGRQLFANSVKESQERSLKIEREHELRMKEMKLSHNQDIRKAANDAEYQHQETTKQFEVKIAMLDKDSAAFKEEAHRKIQFLNNEMNSIIENSRLEQEAYSFRQRECKKQWEETIVNERTEHEKRELELISRHSTELEDCKKALHSTHKAQISILTAQYNSERCRYDKSYETLSCDLVQHKKEAEDRLKEHQSACDANTQLLQSEIAKERKINGEWSQQLHLCKEALGAEISRMKAEMSHIKITNNDYAVRVEELNVNIARLETAKEADVVECQELQTELILSRELLRQMDDKHNVEMKDVVSKHCNEVSFLKKSMMQQHQDREEEWNQSNRDISSKLLQVEIGAKDLESEKRQMAHDIQCLKKQLSENSTNYDSQLANTKKQMEALVVDMQMKEDILKTQMRTFYESELDNLSAQLGMAKSDLKQCQDTLRSNRHPADVEKLKSLAEELAACEESAKKSTMKMIYYKNELKNREENFNSRFGHSKHQKVGVMPTLLNHRPSTSTASRVANVRPRRSTQRTSFPKIM